MLTVQRIPVPAGRRTLALAAIVLGLGSGAAHAQAGPVRYWIPGGPFGFGGGVTESWGTAGWSDVPGFAALSSVDEDGFRTGFVARSYSAPVNAFASGLGWRGFGGVGGAGAFGNFGALALDSSQYGYNFKSVGGLPVTLFGGVDQLKYQPDVFSALTSPGFSSSTNAATAVHAGVEIRPTSNLSLSFSAGYVQPGGAVDSDIRSNLLPGESPMFSGGRR
ncbi:conserved hypothetical protein [Rhodopseudomonas palustris HaA2]|uniref:Porin family protein n=1 Tax=Rhodopseudomonas palustris (strain HaA2) TaxID=316058 RepID=Q2J040_RHOP2|nr:hypothetical protein [Rhodopseudomonas palustris]ABD06170.1 conserved hypothetical protein [Rhodopseudomonas palustris HaA2]